MSNDIERIVLPLGVVARIVPDTDVESPAEWDNVGQIAYLQRSRYVLGTEGVSQERLDEIRDGIADGSLIGLPVFAYVHSGSTIRAAESNPFSCPWDSGQSGYVYCTKDKAMYEFGKKRFTPKVRERALQCLRGEVETFDQYLRGDVYGVIVEVNGEETDDSCYGFFGLDYAREEAQRMGEDAVKKQQREARERAEWEARDVPTVSP